MSQLVFLLNLPAAAAKFKHNAKMPKILTANKRATPGTLYAIVEANINSKLYNFNFIIKEKTILNEINKYKPGFIVAQHLELEAALMRHLSQELSTLANVEFSKVHIARDPIGLLMSVHFRPILHAVAYKNGHFRPVPSKIMYIEKDIVREFKNLLLK